MTAYDRLGELVPDGYRVVEGPRRVQGTTVEFYALRRSAHRAARARNAAADTPLWRYEATRIDLALLADLGRGDVAAPVSPPWWARWALVARQNYLRKNDPEGVQ